MSVKPIFLLQTVLLGVCTAGVFSGVTVAHEWMAPKKDGAIENPISYSVNSVARGKEVYRENCAACHGDNAEGMNAIDAGLNSSTPDLKERLKNHTDGDFFWKIEKGRGEMPSFKDELEPREIWDVINFLKYPE